MARTLAMFTDTSLCIGCRACQVACKQWNELPSEQPEWTGSYQNHEHFTDQTFRLVRFIEEPQPATESKAPGTDLRDNTAPPTAAFGKEGAVASEPSAPRVERPAA